MTNDKSNNIKIYFGDKQDPFEPGKYSIQGKAFGNLKEKLGAKSLTFLNQVHGVNGYSISKGLGLLQREGDFLITNTPGCAVGVLTGDCLPIVIYDYNNGVVSVVHAGWRGSVAGIVNKVIHSMQKKFSSKLRDILVYFGPSAKKCCYEVGRDFHNNINKYRDECFVSKNKKHFFDNIKYNFISSIDLGVLEENIILDNNICTICDLSFHSYRRDNKMSGRQATVVVLK
jgi:hypothetical protein